MPKLITRICTGKYNYIELEEEITDPSKINDMIDSAKALTTLHTSDGAPKSPEVVWGNDFCPDCEKKGIQSLLVEAIGISPKNNKPYHYIKCINNKDKDSVCNYIKWVSVSSIPETKEIEEPPKS